MKLDSRKTAFGRHESFALRYGWLTKGYQAAIHNSNIFKQEDATTTLGVGKNMVNAIRYWLIASQLLDEITNTPTKLGDFLLDIDKGQDPFLEDEATIWLIHWLLSSNPTRATSIFWFFNSFHKADFTSLEAQTALKDYVKENVDTNVSLSTLKNDALLVLRMYTQSKMNSKTPVEESLDSPLSLLRLVSIGATSKNYISKPDSRPYLPLGVLGYAVINVLKERNLTSIPIEELMYSNHGIVAPGATFRMTENALVTKLEQLVNYIPQKLAIRETAGIHQLYLLDEKIQPLTYLKRHYSEVSKGKAA